MEWKRSKQGQGLEGKKNRRRGEEKGRGELRTDEEREAGAGGGETRDEERKMGVGKEKQKS